MLITLTLAGAALYTTARVVRFGLTQSKMTGPTKAAPGVGQAGDGRAKRAPLQPPDETGRVLDRIYDTVVDRLPARVTRGDRRTRQLHAVLEEAGAPKQRTPREQAVNRDIVLATGTLVAASAAKAAYPPLMLLAVPGLAYRFLSVSRAARADWIEERRIKNAFGRVVFHIALLATGRVWTLTMFQCIFTFIDKALVLAYDDSRTALRDVFGNLPKRAWVEREGAVVEVPLEEVAVGDRVVLRSGTTVPVDGVVVDGVVLVDEHALTGEQEPVARRPGEPIFGGTLIVSGRGHARVERTGSDTVQAQIGALLEETVDYRTGTQLFCERIVDSATLPTLAVGAATFGLLGATAGVAAISCGICYQMRATGPLAVQNYLRWTAEQGILIKDGRALERAADVDVVLFDKTGTLTDPVPSVERVHALGSMPADTILRLAGAVEVRQPHPIAEAICEAARRAGVDLPDADAIECVIGHGVAAIVDGARVRVGSERFVGRSEDGGHGPPIGDPSSTVVYVSVDDAIVGAIELTARLRPGALDAVGELQAAGYEVHIVSGDHESTTRSLAGRVGADGYHARVLPQDKASIVRRLQEGGRKVCFVGDGINDAIALKVAHVSVSMRGSTTIALDTAHVILADNDLGRIPLLLSQSAAFTSTMNRNLAACTVPYALNLLGIYLVGTGVVFGVAMSWSGLGLGAFNSSLRPRDPGEPDPSPAPEAAPAPSAGGLDPVAAT